MQNELPITDAERRVMEAVWRQHPVSSRDIIAAVQQETDWQAKTIQTLIRRLADKGMLQHEKTGRRFLYSPAVERDEFIQRKSENFVKSYFKGRVTPLVAAFAETKSLSREDIRELEALVASMKEGNDD